MSEHHDVGMFHAKFGLPNTTDSHPGVRMVDKEMVDFRTKFLHEELEEFEEGLEAGDHAKMFDSLMDLVYVAAGTAHLFGYPWQEGWDLVQTANMAKVRAASDGSDSLRGTSYDVVKPPGWTPPDIEGLLENYSFPSVGEVPVCLICHQGIFARREDYLINSTPGFIQHAHYSCAEKEGLL